MNATQLEGLVLRAVDAVRSGGQPEDDRIEFKRGWPEPEKARQLAATANQAHGEHIIYVIGVDEADGSVHPIDGVDPATWWAQMESRFDEISPDLVLHINVYVSTAEQVVALLFHTDRAPYVVKVQNGGAVEREVPMRAGTRTRSAKRHELIRMLYPAASVPQLTIISGELIIGPPDYYGGDADTTALMQLQLEVFFEHTGSAPIFMPYHAALAKLHSDGVSLTQRAYAQAPRDSGPDNAIHVRRDGIRVAESGILWLFANWKLPRGDIDALGMHAQWAANLDLRLSGSSRSATGSTTLADRSSDTTTVRDDEQVATHTWSVDLSGVV